MLRSSVRVEACPTAEIDRVLGALKEYVLRLFFEHRLSTSGIGHLSLILALRKLEIHLIDIRVMRHFTAPAGP